MIPMHDPNEKRYIGSPGVTDLSPGPFPLTDTCPILNKHERKGRNDGSPESNMKVMGPLTICLIVFVLCFFTHPPALAFTPVDLTRTDVHVRRGIDPAWLNIEPDAEQWLRVPGSDRCRRPVQIRNLPLPELPKHKPFSLKSYTPMDFTLAASFALDDKTVKEPGSLGLYLGSVGVNWEVYLNGRKIHGEVYRNDAGAILHARSLSDQVVELDKRFLKTGKNILNVVVMGDPTDPHTGFYVGRPFFIDRYGDALEMSRRPLTLVLISLYLITGLSFLHLYRKNRSDLPYLFFGLLCVDYFLYKLSMSGISASVITNTAVTGRLELIFLFLLLPMVVGFLDTFLTGRVSRFGKAHALFSLALASFCFWAPPAFLHDLLRLVQASIPVAFVHILILYYRNWFKKLEKKRLLHSLFLSLEGRMLIGITLCFALGTADIFRSVLHLTRHQLSQYGFFMLAFPMGLALVQQFTRNRRELLDSRIAVAQSRQKAIDSLKKADALKDEFLANTSHELRTPLHGIIGLTETALSLEKAEREERLGESLGLILSCARRLSMLIDDILDYSRLNNNDLALHLKPVDMHTAAEVVTALSAPLAEKKGIRLINEIPKNNACVTADENRVGQILQNLVGNAVKFTPGGSVVIFSEPMETHLEISVRDTGMGIEARKLETIFESFRQLDGSTRQQGMGLGLSITKQLVEAHGGEIRVTSTPGSGSTFSFSLPLSREKPEAAILENPVSRISRNQPPRNEAPRSRNTGPARSGHTVLVVDDDPVNLGIVEDFLGGEYRVVALPGGEEALKHLSENEKPDLVLLDIMMPGISGLEVCRRIRQTHDFDKLPIIFLSAKNQVSDLTQGFSLGANDYLPKPFSKQELLARVGYHMDYHTQVETAGRRLNALKEFSGELKNFKGKEQLARAIHDLVEREVEAARCMVFHEKTPVFRSDSSKLPKAFQAVSHMTIPEDTVTLMPFTPPDSTVEGLLMLFRTEYLDGYLFALHRDKAMGPFHKGDREFVENVLGEAASVKENIRNFIRDEAVLKKYLHIQARLSDIYFIQADRQYCRILFEGERELKDFEWSLGDMETYFDENRLLRVHRSFMINPNQSVRAFREKGSRDYTLGFTAPYITEILSKIEDFKGIKLSRAKEQRCKKEFGHWFE